MKIAVITSENIPSQWAHSINLMKHAQGFHNLKYEVEVLVIQGLFEKIYQRKIKNIHDFYDISESIPFYTFLDNPFNFFKKIKYLKSIFHRFIKIFPILERIYVPERNLCNFIKKNKFDLTYARSFQAAYYNILNKNPTILETHSANAKQPKFQNLIKLRENPCFKGIVTIHNDLKNNFIKEGIAPEKVLVLEDAVDLEKFGSLSEPKKKIRETLNFPKEKKIILYAGSLKEGRGIDTIINAAGILNKEDFSFYIIGGNKNEIIKWKSVLKKNHVKADISFLGFKEHKLIPRYLKSADILLAPYTLRCETVRWMSPIKIFEYMASKIPIIASDVKRMKEICKNNECLLFKTDNPIDLSEKIQILMNDKNLENNLIQNAYNKAKTYTYKNRCKKILEYFYNI